MNKLKLTILLLALGVLVNAKNFEGEVSYDITYNSERPESDILMQAFVMNKVVLKFKKDKVRLNFKGGFAGMMMGSYLGFAKENKIFLLKEDVNRYAAINRDSGVQIIKNIENLKLKEEVAGYSCKKYKITTYTNVDTTKEVRYIWVTNKLKVPKKGSERFDELSGLFDSDIKGFPVKMEMHTNVDLIGMVKTTFLLSTYEKKKLADSLFIIPDNFKEVSQSEIDRY